MKKSAIFLIVMTAALGWSPAVYAEKGKKSEPEKVDAKADDKAKDAYLTQLRQNIGALNLQEVTVSVLAAQYQKELNVFQQMQALFCDTYKLDVTKFRQKGYRFDEKTTKFVEQEPPSS